MPTLLLSLALSGCFFGPNEFEGDTPGECTDGADNDQNGLFDCLDPACVDSPDCDPARLTDTGDMGLFASDWQGVQDLFVQRCVICHFEGGSAGFDLTVVIEDELTDGAPGNDRFVVPGDADTSRLWQAVSHSGPAVSMPLGTSTPLPNDEIGHIERWINAGAAL